MNTRRYSYWPYDSAYGLAVAMAPNDSFVYGASGDPYNPRIRRFDRLTGTVSATFDIAASGRGTGSVHDRSIKVTPNGSIFYARDSRKMGLINASALRTNTPVTAEVINAGDNKTVVAGDMLSLSAIAPAPLGDDTYAWRTVAGPGQVTFSKPDSLTTSVQVSAAGNYTLEIVRSNSLWVSRDRISVTATPRPIRLDQVGLNLDGRFQMRLQSGPGTFEIQASSNLLFWEVITNVTSATGDITIADPSAIRAQRFYRARAN
jgi:hypothetical protein